ncbi:hypothetical protein [Rhodococcus fascians]|uniref:hypothetical protein n=1 Tax=Rhodococcoides fascians TaxID=1828 RepID=UPI00068AF454|nr:hypothetical protein [Rhodococcus fascians]
MLAVGRISTGTLSTPASSGEGADLAVDNHDAVAVAAREDRQQHTVFGDGGDDGAELVRVGVDLVADVGADFEGGGVQAGELLARPHDRRGAGRGGFGCGGGGFDACGHGGVSPW